jgi:hypothetical protein
VTWFKCPYFPALLAGVQGRLPLWPAAARRSGFVAAVLTGRAMAVHVSGSVRKVMLMSAGQSQNLPGPLAQAEAAYCDAAGQWPVTGALIARRVRHFAADARLGRDAPQAIRRLREVTVGLPDAPSLSAMLPMVLDGALVLAGADFGTIQLLDPATGTLRVVTQSGFDAGFLDYLAAVNDGSSAWERVARDGVQTVIADAAADPGFAPHRGIAAASGFRAVQCTPLADPAGRLVGVVSAYFRRAYRPPGLDLQVMVLFADVAGEAIAGLLGAPGEAGLGDPAGRAVIPAPLDPGGGPGPGVTALPGPGPACGAASSGEAMPQFAGYVVNRLFSVGLSLESARSIVGPGPAGDRVAAATAEVDRMIRDIRTVVFGLAAGRGNDAPDRWPGPPGGGTGELLARVVRGISEVGVLLRAAAEVREGAARRPVTEALGRLDDLAREVRRHVLAGSARHRAAIADQRAALTVRMAHTARAVQATAADAAALLERQADLAGPPGRMDYRTEIKRWRAFAEQAGQMAARWEQPP